MLYHRLQIIVTLKVKGKTSERASCGSESMPAIVMGFLWGLVQRR
jgi:hypothetical protein